MLWMKGCYETRTRFLLLMLGTLIVSAADSAGNASLSAQHLESTTLIGVSVVASMLLV
jgi:hypothetical protein